MVTNGTESASDARATLLEISRTLHEIREPDDLYRAIYEEAAKLLDTSGFYVALYDQSRDLATVVFYADRGVEQPTSVRYRGSDSEVIRTGRPSIVDESTETASLLVLGDDDSEPTRSAISAPLVCRNRVIGAISAQSYEPDAYGPGDLEVMESLAAIAAVALDNARRMQTLRRARQQAEMIEELARSLVASLDPDEVLEKVVEATLEVVAVDGAAVWLIDGNVARVAASGGSIELPVGAEWPLEAELAEKLLRRKVPAVIEDLAASDLVPTDLRDVLKGGSGLAAPLLVGGRVAGILALGCEDVRGFGEEATRLVERLAAQASVALENARLNARLQALSLTDPLTGLANRRHLRMHLEKETAAAQRGREVSLVIFDLDDFKRHNDTLGHVVGDEILTAVAKILADSARATTLVARYGGDEFVAVLSDSGPDGAEHYIERVEEGVGDDPVLSDHGVTVSVGVATFDPEVMDQGEDLLEAADRGMYEKKESRSLRPHARR